VEKFVPQLDILSHDSVKLFITHGGASSAHEALYFGRPLLVIPHQGDQHLIARLVQKRGAGLFMDKNLFSVEEIISKSKELLTNSSYENNAKKNK